MLTLPPSFPTTFTLTSPATLPKCAPSAAIRCVFGHLLILACLTTASRLLNLFPQSQLNGCSSGPREEGVGYDFGQVGQRWEFVRAEMEAGEAGEAGEEVDASGDGEREARGVDRRVFVGVEATGEGYLRAGSGEGSDEGTRPWWMEMSVAIGGSCTDGWNGSELMEGSETGGAGGASAEETITERYMNSGDGACISITNDSLEHHSAMD
ncbi:hypothetical protein HK101_004637 [Irineochytrium annulatum]|nr:hypothetical protein HK101_004637 [Irineochytrium annulatum]